MPNHCSNTLGIIGPKQDIEDFIELVKNKDENDSDNAYALFENLKPIPEELKGTTSPSKYSNEDLIDKYGYDNWYDWCNANWGTKWGDYDISIDGVKKSGKEYSVNFEYNTAWGPGCNELASAIVNRFPNLNGFISYEEPGMGFAGQLIFKKGEIVSDESWEYNNKYDDVDDIDFDMYGE